jgi:hypothetical protein
MQHAFPDQHTRPEPRTQELEDRSIRDPLPHQRQKQTVIEVIEEPLDVSIDDPPPTPPESRPNPLSGLKGRALRSKAEGASGEVRLEDRLDHELHSCLHDPIANGRNTEVAFSAVMLRNRDASNRLGPILPSSELPLESSEVGLDSLFLDRFDGDSIYTGRPAIAGDLSPRPP